MPEISPSLRSYRKHKDRINAERRERRKCAANPRHKAEVKRNNYKKGQRVRRWFRNYKETSNLKCKYCPEAEPVCLDFHHRDPTQKSFQVGGGAGGRKCGVTRLLQEIDKCDVVCANCHRKITHGKMTETP